MLTEEAKLENLVGRIVIANLKGMSNQGRRLMYAGNFYGREVFVYSLEEFCDRSKGFTGVVTPTDRCTLSLKRDVVEVNVNSYDKPKDLDATLIIEAKKCFSKEDTKKILALWRQRK